VIFQALRIFSSPAKSAPVTSAVTQWAIIAALVAAAFSWFWYSYRVEHKSDFSVIWFGAQELFAGRDPYVGIGPGRAFEWAHPLMYPIPALIVGAPLAYLPMRWTDTIVVGVGIGALTWALLRTPAHHAGLWVLASASAAHVVMTAQWSALLTAAALVPWLGVLLVAKPSLGAALWLAYPSVRAATLGGVFVVLTIVIWPWWPASWLRTISTIGHLTPPVMRWGGPLVLFALIRWRDPRARLLVAMACIPHNPQLSEAVPLFLIPRTSEQGMALAGLTWLTAIVWVNQGPFDGYNEAVNSCGQWMVYLLYLPCLWWVLSAERTRV
jgi:hypothetical protein